MPLAKGEAVLIQNSGKSVKILKKANVKQT